jgi:hypothetical protein
MCVSPALFGDASPLSVFSVSAVACIRVCAEECEAREECLKRAVDLLESDHTKLQSSYSVGLGR